ncbi:MAG: polysaccharide deacetylase family protein [Candidatus Omnitrophica bacterium]|nr:polysaccharide deacetylase family protein [Candidatus Omnitrophota bacterium]
MKSRLLIYFKRSALLFIAFSTVVAILFFIFIAPHRTLPILMYHSISAVEEKNNLSLPKNIFDKQMQYLSKNNYKIISLSEAANLIKQGSSIPNNLLVLNFDDGYRDFYGRAYTILKKYQFKATVFVIIDSLGEKNNLSWEQAQDLAKDDLIDIGAHSLSHRILPLLSREEARKEIFLSKLILETRLNKTIESFCYPYGVLDDSIKELVKEAGFDPL